MEVVFRDYGGYRPRYVNGQELRDWKKAPPIHEYLNQLGEEGWELVSHTQVWGVMKGGAPGTVVPAPVLQAYYLKRPLG
jgi:hypothetical protein